MGPNLGNFYQVIFPREKQKLSAVKETKGYGFGPWARVKARQFFGRAFHSE